MIVIIFFILLLNIKLLDKNSKNDFSETILLENLVISRLTEIWNSISNSMFLIFDFHSKKVK